LLRSAAQAATAAARAGEPAAWDGLRNLAPQA